MKKVAILLKLFVFTLSLILFTALARANDSGAKLVGGGLILQKLENIVMISEDLY